MTWEDNTGPLTSESEAFNLLSRMMDNWANAKPKAGTVKLYLATMQRYPSRYVTQAVDVLIAEHGAFVPTPGELEDQIVECWPPKSFTGAGVDGRLAWRKLCDSCR